MLFTYLLFLWFLRRSFCDVCESESDCSPSLNGGGDSGAGVMVLDSDDVDGIE